MRKIYYVSIFITIIVVSIIGITYSLDYVSDSELAFELIGPSNLYIEVNDEYEEYGIKVTSEGMDISDSVKIDSSSVDTSKVGEYQVKYEVNGEYIYRKVIVIDKEKPVIKLLGGNEVYLLLGGNYEESGYNVIDNYDTDLNDKVERTGSVDTTREGEYTLKYKVIDSGGNVAEAERIVYVRTPVVTTGNEWDNRIVANDYNAYMYSNTVTRNKFLSDGVYLEGYASGWAESYSIKIKNKSSNVEYTFSMNSNGNYYSGNMVLTDIKDGVYDVYIIGSKEERLVNKLNIYTRILRAKVGDKLITFTYDNDVVNMIVEKFEYKYDFAIDPGHGGSDTGTANGVIIEKDLNLKISKYEKCRYESMGYKVYMIRYDDSLGEMLGNSSMDPLDRRGLTIGYYGAVSRVSYSNHHNGAGNTSASGFEILVQTQITAEELEPEMNLYNRYLKFYNLSDDKVRMYTRDYDSHKVFDKSEGQVYSYQNYYSVLRLPYELFNVKHVIYEPIYMSSPSDFNWYYGENNWITVSELKIKEYVNYIGGTYKSDNSMCL